MRVCVRQLLESTELGGFGIDAELVYELTEKLLDMQLLDHADRCVVTRPLWSLPTSGRVQMALRVCVRVDTLVYHIMACT